MTDDINTLPREMRAHVRSFLDAQSRLRTHQVSCAWRDEDPNFQLPEHLRLGMDSEWWRGWPDNYKTGARFVYLHWLDAGGLTWISSERHFGPNIYNEEHRMSLYWDKPCLTCSRDGPAFHLSYRMPLLLHVAELTSIDDAIRIKDYWELPDTARLYWDVGAHTICDHCKSKDYFDFKFTSMDTLLAVVGPWLTKGTWNVPGAFDEARRLLSKHHSSLMESYLLRPFVQKSLRRFDAEHEHRELNRRVRTGEPLGPRYQKLHDAMRRVLHHAPRLMAPMTFYRGISVRLDAQAGDFLTPWGFTWCTRDESLARRFTADTSDYYVTHSQRRFWRTPSGPGTLFVLLLPPGTSYLARHFVRRGAQIHEALVCARTWLVLERRNEVLVVTPV